MASNDQAMGLVWVLFGVAVAGWSSTFPFGGMANPGPGYLPLACGVLLAALGAVLLFKSIPATSEGTQRQRMFPRGAAAWRVSGTVASMAMCAGLMNFIGFVSASFLMALILMRGVGSMKWRSAVLYALVYSVGCYVLFKMVLKTQLPAGILFK